MHQAEQEQGGRGCAQEPPLVRNRGGRSRRIDRANPSHLVVSQPFVLVARERVQLPVSLQDSTAYDVVRGRSYRGLRGFNLNTFAPPMRARKRRCGDCREPLKPPCAYLLPTPPHLPPPCSRA